MNSRIQTAVRRHFGPPEMDEVAPYKVPNQSLVDAFQEYWTAPVDPSGNSMPTPEGYGLGNETSVALKQTWLTMSLTYNGALERHSPFFNPLGALSKDQVEQTRRAWACLGPATGTGKSEFAYAYLGFLGATSGEDGYLPGALLVCRSIEQCNEAVTKVNAWAAYSSPSGSPPVAVAFHSASPTWDAPTLLRSYRIVVMTQEGFKATLRQIVAGDATHSNWDHIHYWEDRDLGKQPRALTIVDENLTSVCDQFDVARLDLKGIYKFATPEMMEDVFLRPAFDTISTAVAAIEHLGKHYQERITAQKEGREPKQDNYLFAEQDMKKLAEVDPLGTGLSRLADALKEAYPSPKETLGPNTARELNATIRALNNLAQVLQLDAYFHRKGKHDVVSAGRYILPHDLPGPCLLDATVNQNGLVSLLGKDRAWIVPMPEGARSYEEVTVHIARVSGTGMSTMGQSPRRKVDRLIGFLRELLKDGDKCLVVSHQEVEDDTLVPALREEHEIKGEVSTAHWFAIDGKNDWNDHNVVVLFGMPYRPRNHTVSLLLAMQEYKDGQTYLDDPETHALRRSIENKTMIAEVIQAINRVRCRRTIDEYGNCARVDVYVLLPKDKTGDAIEEAIQKEMPGVLIKEWDFRLTERDAGGSRRTDPRDRALVVALRTAAQARKPLELGELLRRGGLEDSRDMQDSIARKATRCGSYIGKSLIRLGAWIERRGKGAKLRRYVHFRAEVQEPPKHQVPTPPPVATDGHLVVPR